MSRIREHQKSWRGRDVVRSVCVKDKGTSEIIMVGKGVVRSVYVKDKGTSEIIMVGKGGSKFSVCQG